MVTVYELLEEMLDNGFPLATESNVLKEMIRPPNILRSVVNTLTGKSVTLINCRGSCTFQTHADYTYVANVFTGSSNVGDTLPTGQLSNIPWRRAGVKYTNNEAYFDVIEEIDTIIDKSGAYITVYINKRHTGVELLYKCNRKLFFCPA